MTGVKTAAEAEQAYETILHHAQASQPGARVSGVLIQQMLARWHMR